VDYLTIACLVPIVLAAYLTYRFKNRRRDKSLVFKKKKLPAHKRRRYALLDRDRGKVIPFPGSETMLQKNRPAKNSPDQKQNNQ
jgi:hypothetical protein